MGAEEVVEMEEEEEKKGKESAPATFLPRMTKEEVRMVEEILGYEFTRKELVEEALTHGTFYYPLKPDVTYERLEFMGDAVLTCVIARHAFEAYPGFSPGPLTRLRAANVNTEKLACAAVEHGLHRFLRHKVPKLFTLFGHRWTGRFEAHVWDKNS